MFNLHSCLKKYQFKHYYDLFRKNCKLKMSSKEIKNTWLVNLNSLELPIRGEKQFLTFSIRRKQFLIFFPNLIAISPITSFYRHGNEHLKIIFKQFSDKFFHSNSLIFAYSFHILFSPIHSNALVHFETLSECSRQVLNSTSFQFCYFSLTCCFKPMGNKFLKTYATDAVSDS